MVKILIFCNKEWKFRPRERKKQREGKKQPQEEDFWQGGMLPGRLNEDMPG